MISKYYSFGFYLWAEACNESCSMHCVWLIATNILLRMYLLRKFMRNGEENSMGKIWNDSTVMYFKNRTTLLKNFSNLRNAIFIRLARIMYQHIIIKIELLTLLHRYPIPHVPFSWHEEISPNFQFAFWCTIFVWL